MNLTVLQFKTTTNFSNNLDTLISLINKTSENSFVVAPELVLTGYAYDRLDEAVQLTLKAKDILLDLSQTRTICLTMTTKKIINIIIHFMFFIKIK